MELIKSLFLGPVTKYHHFHIHAMHTEITTLMNFGEALQKSVVGKGKVTYRGFQTLLGSVEQYPTWEVFVEIREMHKLKWIQDYPNSLYVYQISKNPVTAEKIKTTLKEQHLQGYQIEFHANYILDTQLLSSYVPFLKEIHSPDIKKRVFLAIQKRTKFAPDDLWRHQLKTAFPTLLRIIDINYVLRSQQVH